MSSSLNQIVSNSLWFSFDALDQHKTGVVDKSRLKELTRQIAETLLVERTVENCLSDYRSTDTLTFDQYLHFLEYEVFSDVCKGSDTPYSEMERFHASLDALFWEVGRHSLAPRYPAVLSPKDTFKMFRVFCMLADRSNDAGSDLVQVSVRRSEVCEVCRHLVDGLGMDWDWNDWQMVSGSISTFPLPVFLTFLEGRYAQNTESSALSASVENVYRFFVGQVFYKGKAYQRITRAGGWLRRDIEVVPWGIRSMVDTNEDYPEEGMKRTNQQASPNKVIGNAVGKSLTLGRNAVGLVGGAMKTGVNGVMERSRTLKRNSSAKQDGGDKAPKPIGPGPKRVFSVGSRWGSASAINNKKKNNDSDRASLGGRETPSPKLDSKRSHTLERCKQRSGSVTSSLDTSPTKGVASPMRGQTPKESTKGVVGGVIGKVWRLAITPQTEVVPLKDSSSGRSCQVSVVSTPTSRPVVIAATDHKSKARLIAALHEAVQHCSDSLPYQMRVSMSRRSEEEQQNVKEDEERVRRNSQADIIEQTQAELALERSAREEAECLALNESMARAAEEGRVAELTTLRQQLEALLEQEKNAKRDEEIVRNLQARVLREEWAKREELEKLQVEQQHILEEEQRKRRAFEILQKEQEKKLREAESKLKSLDSDRRRLDEELRSAREKIVMSERGKQLLEAKMKVSEGRRPPIRTLSLRPSRQERSSPARSSSFTTPPTHLGIPSPTAHSKPLPGDIMTPPAKFPSPSNSAASTPASTPTGGNANKSFADSLPNGNKSPSTPPTSSSPIKSIPEVEEQNSIGWKIRVENGETEEKRGNFNEKFIEIKTYEEKQTLPVDVMAENKVGTFDLLSEIDGETVVTKSVTDDQGETVVTKSVTEEEGETKTVVTKSVTDEDGVELTVTETVTTKE